MVAEGANVALNPSAVVATVPGTTVFPCFSPKADAVSGAIALSNLTESFVLMGTAVAVSEGYVRVMVGAGSVLQAANAMTTRALARRDKGILRVDG